MARDAARKLEDQLGRLKTEARGLAQLAAPQGKAGFAKALDAVSPDRGYEAALAAALGDDLDAALDDKAPAYWGGAETVAAAPPEGAEPLASLVAAPPALAARLAYVFLVARADGARLQQALLPGMRLVSREGDLWRWDGFVSRAEAPRPAAVRLAQKARLAELEAEIDALAPQAGEAVNRAREATQRLQQAEEALKAARRGPQDAERLVAQAREGVDRFAREQARRDARAQSLDETIARFEAELAETEAALALVRGETEALPPPDDLAPRLSAARAAAATAREAAGEARAALDVERRERSGREQRLASLQRDRDDWVRRSGHAAGRVEALGADRAKADAVLAEVKSAPETLTARTAKLLDEHQAAESRRAKAADALAAAERQAAEADRASRAADAAAAQARERKAALDARAEAAIERLAETSAAIHAQAGVDPEALGRQLVEEARALPSDPGRIEAHLQALERELDGIGAVNLRAEEEAVEYADRLNTLRTERADLQGAIDRLREGIEELNAEGRERLIAAFDVIHDNFQTLFQALFGGGQAELRLIESDDPLEAGLEIYACPPGKKMAVMSLMSGGEQALTAAALIFGVFLANPAPICVLDEVDAPLDDANVDRFCNMLEEMRKKTATRFVAVTHNPVTMARMDRLFGVTMAERGVSQLVSVNLQQAEALAAE
jgi:chromosome segregation protein